MKHSRLYYGNLSAIVGIACNLVLCICKVAVGVLFGSLAIMADGFNNLSDLGSNMVSLVGFKVAAKPADREHPFGHARAEYIAAMIVAFIVFVLGFELIVSAVEKFITPTAPDFSNIPLSVAVLGFSIVVKLFMFLFNRHLGKLTDSPVLKATATDSISDVVATAAVLVSLILAKLINVDLDAYMAIAVAVFIIISGLKIIKETFSQLLGEAPTTQWEDHIRNKIMSYDGVLGIHDLMVHNYGPDRVFASVHVEVDANKPIMESHDMIDLIEQDMASQLHLVIHLDPIVVDDPVVNEMRIEAEKIVEKVDATFRMHDFRMVKGPTHTNFIFDIVVPFECKKPTEQIKSEIDASFKQLDSTYYTVITIDRG